MALWDSGEIHWEWVRRSEGDMALIFRWRNDPVTRAMSRSREEKVWERFIEEFWIRCDIRAQPPLFAIWEGERVGVLFFERSPHMREECWEISIVVSPEARGKGLGRKILREVIPIVARQGCERLWAEIRFENKASQLLFERAGFRRVRENREFFFYDLLLREPLAAPFRERALLIAEIGSNWRLGGEGDLELAKAMIEAAAEAGADGVKFQTFTPSELYAEGSALAPYLEKGGERGDLGGLFKRLQMPHEMIPRLSECCRRSGLLFMSTPFSEGDFEAVDPYVAIHKIASYELNHWPLLKRAARSGKPLLLSTGAATVQEIAMALKCIEKAGGAKPILLQCCAAYPAPSEAVGMDALRHLRERFHTRIGLSDHTTDPLCAPLAAIALGAVAIEKHFTLSNQLPGPDHPFALTPLQFRAMVEGVRRLEEMLGDGVKRVQGVEEELRQFARRAIQARRAIAPGEALHLGENIALLRPGTLLRGADPCFLNQIEGGIALHAIGAGEGVRLEDVEA